jgi:hypothetical protein
MLVAGDKAPIVVSFRLVVQGNRRSISMVKSIKAEDFDRVFDDGQKDIVEYLDLSSVRQPNRKTRKVNVDLPEWIINSLDAEAERLAINRQAVIKTWLAEKIDSFHSVQ